MSTESTYSAVIPAGATILRVVETDGARSVEVSIPMKEAPPPSFAAVEASYRRRVEELQWPRSRVGSPAQRAEEERKNREATVAAFNRIKTTIDALERIELKPLPFTLWPEPVTFGMDLAAPDESVEGIVAQPKDDVVDAEFNPDDLSGARVGCNCVGCRIMRSLSATPVPDPEKVQEVANPERPNRITAEWFKESVGQEPGGDDLERCNCRRTGAIGHMYCGWDDTRDMPNFMPGLSKRFRPSDAFVIMTPEGHRYTIRRDGHIEGFPEGCAVFNGLTPAENAEKGGLLARIAELEALLNAPHTGKAAEMAAGEPGQPRVMVLAEELALWGPWTGKIAEDPLYLYACDVAIEISKNASRPPQLIIAPLYSGLCARLRGDA